MSECYSKKCSEPVAIRVYWPGKSPPPEYCFECAEKMQKVAGAIGLTVHVEPIVLEQMPR